MSPVAPPGTQRLRVVFDAVYSFAAAASPVHALVRLRPLPSRGPQRSACRLAIEPADAVVTELRAGWQTIDHVALERPCARLRINADVSLERSGAARPALPPAAAADLCDEDGVRHGTAGLPLAACRALLLELGASWRYRDDAPGEPEFARIAAERAGDCRGLARLAAHRLRRLGVPTRFVGGFRMAPGDRAESRRRHVWIACLTADQGWCEIDPADGDTGPALLGTTCGPRIADIQPISGAFGAGARVRVTTTVQVLREARLMAAAAAAGRLSMGA